MSGSTGGYSFCLEFNETFANKIVRAIFRDTIVPTLFSQDDEREGGMISSRGNVSGQVAYKKYLIEGLLGYEITLSNPQLAFQPATQSIGLSLDFGMTVSRQALLKTFSPAMDLRLPANPDDVDPTNDYHTVYDSGVRPPAGDPPTPGRIALQLPLILQSAAGGRRIAVNCEEATLSVVTRIHVEAEWAEDLVRFLNVLASKFITEALRREVEHLDVTPLFGSLRSFDLELRPPIEFGLRRTSGRPALLVGLHEFNLVGNGELENVSLETGRADFAVHFKDGFFARLIRSLFNTGIIRQRYSTGGRPDPEGPLLLHPPRLSRNEGGFHFATKVDWDPYLDLFIAADVTLSVPSPGEIQAKVHSIRVHPRLQSVLGGIQALFNFMTFQVLDNLIAKILGELLSGAVNRGVGNTLESFLENGQIAFALESPIANSQTKAKVVADNLIVAPGRLVLTGMLDV